MRTPAPFVEPRPDLWQALLQVGLTLLIQSTLLLVVGLVGGAALRRLHPALSCLLYRATLLGVMVCVLLSGSLSGRFRPFWSLALPPAWEASMVSVEESPAGSDERATRSQGAGRPHGASTPAVPLLDARGRAVTVQIRSAEPRTSGSGVSEWPFQPYQEFLRPNDSPSRRTRMGRLYAGAMGLWLGGALGLLAWLLICYRGIARLSSRSVPLVDGEIQSLLRRLCELQGVPPPPVRICPEVQSVFLTGLWRPMILLPVTYATDFDGPALRAVLAHEVAHLARRDPGWTLFARLLCAVVWIQPLLWILCRRWDEVREEVCDLAVLRDPGVSPRAYADCLLRLAERLAPATPQRIVGTGIILFRSSLGQRVERLLTGSSCPTAAPSPRLRTTVVLGTACAVVSATLLVSAAGAPGSDSGTRDARREQRVTITAEGISLGELIPLLARASGISMAVSPELADEKVILFGPARPLQDVMADLAALLHAFWLRTQATDGKPRYTLARDLKSRQYEEQLARANEIRLLAQLEAQVKALAETPEQLARRPESDPIRQALSTPDGRAGTQVYAMWSPRQRQQLIERWHLRVPVSLLDEKLKDQIGHLFHGPLVKADERGFGPTPIPRAEMDRHELTFAIWGTRGIHLQSGHLRVTMTAPTGLGPAVTSFHTSTKFPLPPHGNPYTGAKIPEGAPLPDPKAVRGVAEGAWPDRLRQLAEKTGRPVVSDYYRSKPINVAAAGEDALAAPPATPAGELDAFCRPEGYLWWARGQTLLFRKRDWYNQRLYEVPDRWVIALAQRLQAQNGMPTVADVLSLLPLSTHQIVGLNESLGLDSGRQFLTGLRELLALVAALPGEKAVPVFSGILVAGQAGRVAMTPDVQDRRQRALLEAFLEAYRNAISPQHAFSGEFGVVLHSADLDSRAHPGYRSVYAHLYLGKIYRGQGTIQFGYPLALPLALPDDRRAKTRIEFDG